MSVPNIPLRPSEPQRSASIPRSSPSTSTQQQPGMDSPAGHREDWQTWDPAVDPGPSTIPAHSEVPPTTDWQDWFSSMTPAQPSPTPNPASSSIQPQSQPHTVLPNLQVHIPSYPTQIPQPIPPAPIVSPIVTPTSDSLFETAKGLAMISLEAAAEPHYVGESSGSLWTTLVSRGMQVPPTALEGPSAQPVVETAPTPLHLALLRANLQRAIPNHVADAMLETVYRHLHSRVSAAIQTHVHAD
jgi:hypothetical protein